jgi:endonuclease/exonuclease/phosphatase family metal-dependent hydrolase
MVAVRVLSWNLHGMRDDRAAVLRVLRAVDADVVCLQEAPRRPSTPGTRWRLRRLAAASGLRLVRGGREAAGNALLVSGRIEVVGAEAVRLPSPRWVLRQRQGRRGRRPRLRIGEQRGVVVAELRLPTDGSEPGAAATELVVAAVHLSLDGVERLRHVAMILELIARRPGRPVLIAGDLNELPDGPAWRVLAGVAADPRPGGPPTYPAAGPQQRIDAILLSAGVTVAGYGDAADIAAHPAAPADLAVASDHRPVVADLRF